MTGIRLYQATDSGWANIGGKDVLIQAGQIAHGDHPVLKSHGHMFSPMVIDYGPPGPAEDEGEGEAKTEPAKSARGGPEGQARAGQRGGQSRTGKT